MKRLKKHAAALKTLSLSKPNMCKAIIKHGDKDLIKCLCEISHNIIKGNVPLSIVQKRKLLKYKTPLRQLANVKRSNLSKKKTLLQKGGFLGALLGPILGVIGSLLNS